MSHRTVLRLTCVAALTLVAAGCMTYRGPRGVEKALEEQLGVEMDREYGIKLGWTSTKIVLALTRDDDEPALDFDLDGIGVATFVLPPGARKVRLDPESLGLDGWDTAIRVHDEDGSVLLVTRGRKGKIHEMIFVSVDDEEAVLGRLNGDLGRLVEKMVRDTQKSGTRAAKRALPASS